MNPAALNRRNDLNMIGGLVIDTVVCLLSVTPCPVDSGAISFHLFQLS
jgi:hypothetical protein